MNSDRKQLLYILDVRAENATMDVMLNDVLVSTISERGRLAKQSVVNAYVHTGENRITLQGRPTTLGVPRVEWRLIKTHRAADATETTLAAGMVPGATVRLEGDGTFTAAASSTIDEAFGRWYWEEPGVPLFEPQRDTPSIMQAVRNVWNALSGRDVDVLMKMIQVKCEELARALQLPAASLLEDAREHFEYLFAASAWKLKPLRTDDVRLTPMAAGKAIAIRSINGGSAIESEAGPPYSLDLLLSRAGSNGDWQIVR